MIWNNDNEWHLEGINTLLIRAAKHLLDYGVHRSNKRTDSDIIELHNYSMQGNPKFRYITIPERKNNLAAQITEMMMVISGNPELHQLSKFLPRAVDYSDDGGETWRGNYGTRIRGINVFESPLNNAYKFPQTLWQDQLAKVIEQLKKDPTTRQATITIHDSKIDTGIPTKDTPCTMDLVFSIDVEGRLELTTTMRSNDIQFGFSGVNYFIFTMLQELVASCLYREVGVYCHQVVSFHIYNNYFSKLQEYCKYYKPETGDIDCTEVSLGDMFSNRKGYNLDLKEFDNIAKTFFDILSLSDEYSNKEHATKLAEEGLLYLLEMYPGITFIELLAIPIGYHFGFNRDDMYNKYVSIPEIKFLMDRDPFLNKHLA